MSNTSGQAYALMVMTPVRDGEQDALRRYLEGLPSGARSPLARLGGTHFARWLVLPDLVYQGAPQERDSLSSAYLIFTSNFDGELERYLTDLVTLLPAEVDAIWGRCINCPRSEDPDAFVGYLRHNQIDTAFFFCAYPEATVDDVLAALELRARITALAVRAQGLDPAALHAAYAAEFAVPAGSG